MVLAFLAVALGTVVTLGIGRRRGTASYRLRVALWVALVSLGGGTVLASTLAAGDDPPATKPTVHYDCYAGFEIEGVLTIPDVMAQSPAGDPDLTFQPSTAEPDVTSEPAPEAGSTASQPAPTVPDAVSQPGPAAQDVRAQPPNVSPKPELPYPVETCYFVM